MPFSSNSVRLSPREWVVVAAIVLAVFCLGPRLWKTAENFEPGPDYRLPYQLSNDYWLYKRYCQWACSQHKTLVIGDSVIWGHFVSKHNTLSGYLNKTVSRNQFTNLGVDGIHPVALAGLLKYYGGPITGKKVILHFNPLWLSSKKHDLQITKEFHFDHPKLVPQFIPNIPCYKVPYSKKISAIVQRYVPFFSWVSHLKIAYFESMDLSTWLVGWQPQAQLGDGLGSTDVGSSHRHPYGMTLPHSLDTQWVALETSLQWRFFQSSVKILKARANTVFVLVGPFNEHMLKPKSIDTYRKMKSKIEAWLKQNDVPCYMPPVLPSELYRDASHPLSEGYALLAKELFENKSFRSTILEK
ncbi:MAG: hypothetical protein ACE5NM_10885 [Sedimentisphaerales bacterium]